MKINIFRFIVFSGFRVILFLSLNAPLYAQSLEVIPIPANPGRAHDTNNSVQTMFMAIARGGDGNYTYEWDFNGDGTYDFSRTTADPYDLSTSHTYPVQASNRLFIAKIRVISGEETVTAEYPVMVHEPATGEVESYMTISKALWYLHTQMIRIFSGGLEMGYLPDQSLAATAMAVQAWRKYGNGPSGDIVSNPYVEDVRRGLNYCLAKTFTREISPQPAGDPDTNGNGIGLFSWQEADGMIFETGAVLMAIAGLGFDMVADTRLPDANVAGRRYRDISQDMVDFLAYAQNESNALWRGGWRYFPNYNDSDMWITPWSVFGLRAVEGLTDITIPGWVKAELKNNFLTWIQGEDGGFGYIFPGDSNVSRTGAGLACQEWVGLKINDPAVQATTDYLDANWYSLGVDDNVGNIFAMYAVYKGMSGFNFFFDSSFSWYGDYARWLFSNQESNGGWYDCCGFSSGMTTAMGLLILREGPEVDQDPIGYVKGFVSDSHTGAYLKNALIEAKYGYAISLPNGSYIMALPIGFITVTAQMTGYIPISYTVQIPDFEFATLNFVLTPVDTDTDGIPDNIEFETPCLDYKDADTDDDGITDGTEDKNLNGTVDTGETDPCNVDTDGDGIQDGTEVGLTLADIGPDTDTGVFKLDADPTTTTNPTSVDTDGDELSDGQEDANHNGSVDVGETDPTASNADKPEAMPWILLLLSED